MPTYLRLNRTGTTYTGYYSADGVNWTEAGSFTDSSLTVTGLAPYGWNYNATPSNAVAVTASFDWFHNTTTSATVATPTFNPAERDHLFFYAECVDCRQHAGFDHPLHHRREHADYVFTSVCELDHDQCIDYDSSIGDRERVRSERRRLCVLYAERRRGGHAEH